MEPHLVASFRMMDCAYKKAKVNLLIVIIRGFTGVVLSDELTNNLRGRDNWMLMVPPQCFEDLPWLHEIPFVHSNSHLNDKLLLVGDDVHEFWMKEVEVE